MFADTDLSDEMAEKIVAFVEREDGRDAPLTADDEAMVRRLIEEDPAVRALVDDLRATNIGLDTLLDDVAAVEVPERLVTMIRSHGTSDVAVADPEERAERPRRSDNTDAPIAGDDQAAGGDGDVVSFRRPASRRRSYGPLAAAASIACLISSAALVHVYTSSKAERERFQASIAQATEEADSQGEQLADARAELRRLSGLAEQASDQSRETADQLMANEEAVQRLEVERAALEGRYAALEGENERLNDMLERQRADITDSEEARDQIAADLADARQLLAEAASEAADAEGILRAEVDDLMGKLDQRDREMASLAEELAAREESVASIGDDLAQLRDQRSELERQLASAELDKERLQAERETAEQAVVDAERQLATLEASVQDAEGRLATVAAGLASAEAGRRDAVQRVFGLEAELAASTSWLGQIAQYHRVYASTARRHLVEVGADELDHIQEWLTTMVGRDIQVPDLTGYGVTFVGARLLGINEQPVAQLVYLDENDQPLALCIIPSTGAAKSPSLSTNRDLNLVDWRDGRHGYAVVGWSDPELLTSLTEAIQPLYDL